MSQRHAHDRRRKSCKNHHKCKKNHKCRKDHLSARKGSFCKLDVQQKLSVKGVSTLKYRSRKMTKKDMRRRAKNGSPDEKNDLIVIGAGTAGSLLINRLAERYPTKKILVLDPGQDDVRVDTATSAVPNPNPPGGTAFVDAWGQLIRFTVAFGEGCAQIQQEMVRSQTAQLFIPPAQFSRGYTLGGTSAIHASIWNRGTNEGTYDRWEKWTGDPSFGPSQMNEVYKILENRTQSSLFFGSESRFWVPGVGPNPGRTLNPAVMGTTGELFLTSYTVSAWDGEALKQVIGSIILPGRSAPLPINQPDVFSGPEPPEYQYTTPQ